MISGALVFYKPKPFVPFIKQRLLRIVLPMVIWTIFALLLWCCMGTMKWSQLPNSLMLLPFKPQVGVYWFIYVIFGIYLLTPMIATWLERCSKRDVEILLLVGAVVSILPYLSIIDQDFMLAITVQRGAFYYFAGYLWVALAGYYIRRYVSIERFKWWHALIFVVVLSLPFLLRAMGINYGIIQRRTSFNVLLLCACYFIFLKHVKLSETMKKIVYDFAQHSFGIYLVHKFITNHVLGPIVNHFDMNYCVSIPFVFICTTIISYLIVHLISKLPYSKYIVGL